ncbi:hypothetical protein H0H93_006403, partial [Arthromyces matolae]
PISFLRGTRPWCPLRVATPPPAGTCPLICLSWPLKESRTPSSPSLPLPQTCTQALRASPSHLLV